MLTGSEKAFAAGADIKEMLEMDYHEMESHDRNESLLQVMIVTQLSYSNNSHNNNNGKQKIWIWNNIELPCCFFD